MTFSMPETIHLLMRAAILEVLCLKNAERNFGYIRSEVIPVSCIAPKNHRMKQNITGCLWFDINFNTYKWLVWSAQCRRAFFKVGCEEGCLGGLLAVILYCEYQWVYQWSLSVYKQWRRLGSSLLHWFCLSGLTTPCDNY